MAIVGRYIAPSVEYLGYNIKLCRWSPPTSFEMKIDPLKRLTKQRARLSSGPTLNTLCTMDIFSLICLLSFVPSTGCWDRMPLTSAEGSGSLWPKTSTLFWLSSYFLLDAAPVMAHEITVLRPTAVTDAAVHSEWLASASGTYPVETLLVVHAIWSWQWKMNALCGGLVSLFCWRQHVLH